MKVFIIHSSGMYKDALTHAESLEADGHETYVPLRDTEQVLTTEHAIINNNQKGIEWCDECHVLWDLSSLGSIFDMGEAHMARKPTKIVKLKNHHWVKFIIEHEGRYIFTEDTFNPS